MKISYRTHPVLGLMSGSNFDFQLEGNAPKDKIIECLKDVFGYRGKELLSNIIYASPAFIEAAMSCSPKMISNELYKEIGDEFSGVLLYGHATFIYDLKRVNINGTGAWLINVIEFYAGVALKTICWGNSINYTHKHDEGDHDDPIEAAKDLCGFIQMVLMFKKFAQVETKLLPAGQKVNCINCKYVNDTNMNITYLTSTWFTTLVKSDAFKVRGHFRLQPCGEGLKDRKLIWVNDFEKGGYTAPARKL
jgi:hypothetical protein